MKRFWTIYEKYIDLCLEIFWLACIGMIIGLMLIFMGEVLRGNSMNVVWWISTFLGYSISLKIFWTLRKLKRKAIVAKWEIVLAAICLIGMIIGAMKY